jgi:hypothetical protein
LVSGGAAILAGALTWSMVGDWSTVELFVQAVQIAQNVQAVRSLREIPTI